MPFRLVIYGYVVAALCGYIVGIAFGWLPGVLLAWIGGAGFALLASFIEFVFADEGVALRVHDRKPDHRHAGAES